MNNPAATPHRLFDLTFAAFWVQIDVNNLALNSLHFAGFRPLGESPAKDIPRYGHMPVSTIGSVLNIFRVKKTNRDKT